ncbi:a16c59be-7e52-439a-b3ba-00b7c528cfdb [Thermothielavioides terrestris]|uniref:A16c59be-7e52-439a-b3ba-00b7c528cfdb n=1 Tax=Thermothielavioides terrestris TaxID=2587410 RepID=A0A446BQQ9_9PEZI|nr:a16c59be-7e52-439a-b3ba-00b7c528cfdb [Thermothielavioides terrestris]
MSSKIATV